MTELTKNGGGIEIGIGFEGVSISSPYCPKGEQEDLLRLMDNILLRAIQTYKEIKTKNNKNPMVG